MTTSHASRVALFLMLATAPIPRAASAQAVGETGRRSAIVFYTENDDWWPDTGTDKNYTNAFRLTLDRNYDMFRLRQRMPKLFGWVPDHVDCSTVSPADNPDLKCVSTQLHTPGQQFYTPDDITIPSLIPHDRPYAGWLYVGGSWQASTADTLVASDAYIGVTGEPSLAEPVQSFWHARVGAPHPEGWDNQIGTRLGLVIGHSRHRAFDAVARGRRWLEIVPYAGATAGNVITDAYGGARLRIGFNISRDWTQTGIAPRIDPTGAGAQVQQAGNFELYLIVDGQGRALAYNAFIDAAKGHVLNRRFLVADGGIGAGFRFKRFGFSYRVAFVSPEYAETRVHDYKALKLTFGI